MPDLQRHLDAFRAYYNHHRPHRALHSATPAERFDATPPARPADNPLYLPRPPVLSIAERTVTPTGCVNAACTGIALGTRWAGHTVTAITYGTPRGHRRRHHPHPTADHRPHPHHQPLPLPKS